jgi:3-hydroxy-3-methylglutaryl CoA synthase
MTGIAAYGVYIPKNRLDRKELARAFQKSTAPGEKAVANFDEDSITMSVAAALECTKNTDVSKIDSIFFASTTSPYKEKQCATTIAGAIDAQKNVRTADFANTLRAGSAAILAASDAAPEKQTLVAVGDCRLGAADGNYEAAFGDAAAAFLISNKNVIAEIKDSYSVAVDFFDTWRSDSDVFVRNWEDRFGNTQGYIPFVSAAVQGVLEKTKLKPADFTKIVLYGSSERYQKELAVKLGFTPEQIQDGFFNSVGNAGAAGAPLMLAAALDEAKPGDKFLFVSYGEGSDAIVIEATPEIKKAIRPRSVQSWISDKKATMQYEKYLRWRNLLNFEPAKRPDLVRTSIPLYFRNFKRVYALYGSKCKKCGMPQFPQDRVCAKCGAVDQMEEYRFYGKKAKLATFTIDYLAATLDSPNVSVVVDFEGGGRMFTSLVDCDLDKIEVGMPIAMTYRKLFSANGMHTYYWKAIPSLG